MFAFAAVSPGIGLPPPNEIPHVLTPRADLLSTLTVLIIGLVLVAAAIRSVTK